MNTANLARIIIILVFAALTGCTTLSKDTKGVRSITDAGISHVQTHIVVGTDKDKKLGTEYTVNLGKEYQSFKLNVGFTADGKPKVRITAMGVGAFVGQTSAHAALVRAREQITKQNISQADAGAKAAVAAIDAAIKVLVPVP